MGSEPIFKCIYVGQNGISAAAANIKGQTILLGTHFLFGRNQIPSTMIGAAKIIIAGGKISVAIVVTAINPQKINPPAAVAIWRKGFCTASYADSVAIAGN